jgi:hypothetical protein
MARAFCMGISLAKYFVDLWQAVGRSGVRLDVEDRVRVVDTYSRRFPGADRSWFDGMSGRVVALDPPVLVHLDGEPWPMLFDCRDLVREAPR